MIYGKVKLTNWLGGVGINGKKMAANVHKLPAIALQMQKQP
jgi:hypothetical protein